MAIKPWLTAVIASLFIAAASWPSLAKGPVALATSVSGQTTPAIEAFSEFQSDTKLKLLADTEIEFVHYPTCQTVIVKGGRLSFSSERYFLKKGKILSTKRAKCPRTVALAGASQIGGLVLRGSSTNKSLKVSLNPTFVLVGDGTGSVEEISVSQDGKLIAEAMKPGRVFHWPENVPSLQKGQTYMVTLKIKGQTETQSFTIESKGGAEAITLIRLN